MDRFICIHGHFYQPPRENPWLEEIELQGSAAPFHDWNERITAECYDPNRASRILDESGAITDIINNYSKISFNFGPTLLSWLQRHSPATHNAIVTADLRSRDNFQGHGAALAQAWGHIILPLANRRDKQTQIIWGIKDFESRFNRSPEGMWLPEAAVDLETLELLAEHGLRFTLLSPFQARRVRKLGQKGWTEVVNGLVDPRQPYLCRLPSGRTIALFFYDGEIAREIAFGGLLNSGEDLADKLLAPFDAAPAQVQLVNVATDGESYGHHHRFGDMALAYALKKLEAKDDVAITIYGAFLERFPPQMEVEIIEKSSWSCAHGIERWRSDCGCHTGLQAGWTQAWRAPLREALDWLHDRIDRLYEDYARRLFPEPWKTRDNYIAVVLDRNPERVQHFLNEQARRELSTDDSRSALQLLEMQRHAMQMFTSCGWFFDEVSGIETVQLLAYAGRAIHLAEESCNAKLEDDFRLRLARVPSNKPRWRDAGRIYDELVSPSKVDLARVAAHHAIASLFGLDGEEGLYAYVCEDISRRQVSSARTELAVGRVRIRSSLTWEEETFNYAVIHYGDHHVTAGVRKGRDDAAIAEASEQLCTVFEKGDLEQTLRLVDRHFGGGTFTLSHLFKDEQQRIVKRIIRRQLDDILGHFRTIYEDHLALLGFLREIGMTIPSPLAAATEQIINDELLHILSDSSDNSARMRELLAEADRFELKLDQPQLSFAASGKGRRLLTELAKAPRDHAALRRAVDGLRQLRDLPWAIDLWQAQNIYLDIQDQTAVELFGNSTQNEGEAKIWLDLFRQLGKLLAIRVTPAT